MRVVTRSGNVVDSFPMELSDSEMDEAENEIIHLLEGACFGFLRENGTGYRAFRSENVESIELIEARPF